MAAFWTWGIVEVLRSTGIRIEELLEISHHSLVQYRLPTTGELVPLLQIAPSKAERAAMALFPSRVRNAQGTRSISYGMFQARFKAWVESLDLGPAVSHQARHTLATNGRG